MAARLTAAAAPALTELFDHARARKALEPPGAAVLDELLTTASLLCLDLLEDER